MDGNNAAKDKEVELTERGFLYLAKSTPRILLFAVKSLYRIGRGTINLVRKKSFRETIKSLPRVPIVMFKLLYNARTRSIDFVEKMRGKQQITVSSEKQQTKIRPKESIQQQKTSQISIPRDHLTREQGPPTNGNSSMEKPQILKSNSEFKTKTNRKVSHQQSLQSVKVRATNKAKQLNRRNSAQRSGNLNRNIPATTR
ncbi:TPA: flagellar protein FliS [Enterococcus faecium]|uniref:Flagellar protein FliS n=1 Tax=Enterococcus faecium TaxID=1352 RepID=A0AB74CVF4_ENTFC|nr:MULTISPECIES: hypothetical protein [Enterococcus]EGP4987898.1 flagellar protein FliS [Enterococcus faecium]EGP5230847.1 flagellar protein FliS [Enterococcus faecium]EGP5256155.1 flagellar protein FliS [Enterococcus faecium]EME7080945.1 flagellar protein FliS [Enterococcus faecium]EME7144158.1 flagellar protein FliS [Enterococcus faecium]